MSEPTSAPKPSAAIARAERRLWLLDLMLGLCAVLLRVVRANEVHPSGASLVWLQWARNQAAAAIACATGLAQRLKTETELELCVLRARPARHIAAAPPAARHERAETPDHASRAPREGRQVVQTQGDDAAFRARLEALEAFLDRQADGPNAGLPALQVAYRLCEALGLNPDWSRWLEDDWLAANLDLRRLPASAGESGPASAPLCIPPPPPRGPPAPAGQERIGPQPPPHAIRDDPEILRTYKPGFKETLGRLVLEAIEANAYCDEEVTFLSGVLEQRLATNEPYMWGCRVPMRSAVRILLEDKLRVWPNWTRWRDDKWIDDGFNARRRNAETEARLRARGVDLGETGPYQPPRLPR